MPKDRGARCVLSSHAYAVGPRFLLDAYAPRQFNERLPLLFFIYGGGWDSGNREEYEFVGRAFAAAGFITAIADYRLVPDVRYPTFLEDCAAALNEALGVLPAFGADTSRVFLMGHSAGAYNAVMLGLDGPRFGMADLGPRLKGVVGLSGAYDFYPYDVSQAIAAFSGTPEPLLSQPINIAHSEAPPFFLSHGTADRVCGPYNTGNLAERLRMVGVSVVERYYCGMLHPTPLLALSPILRWRAPVYRETVAFMRELS